MKIKYGPIKSQRHMISNRELALVNELSRRGIYSNEIRFDSNLVIDSAKGSSGLGAKKPE